MDQVLDPNDYEDIEDFGPQTASIARQRKVAEMLRKESEREMPSGQMVSGRYVAPSIFQMIRNPIASYRSGAADRDLAKKEDAYTASAGQARDKWASNFPQALPGRAEMQGPVDPNTGSPELAAVAAQPVTSAQVFKKYLAGAKIPGNEKASEAYLKMAGDDRTREDTQAFRSEEAKATRLKEIQFHTERLAQQAEAARIRSEDTRASIEQRAEAAREAAQARRDIAAMQNETRRLQIETAKEVGLARAEAAANKGGERKPLPAGLAKAWLNNREGLNSAAKTLNMLVDETGKVRPEAAKHLSVLYKVPGAETVGQYTDPKGVPIRAGIANIGSLKIHERSGATVTASEHPRLAPFVPNAGDTPQAAADKIRDFVAEYEAMQEELQTYADEMKYIVPGKSSGATGSWSPPPGVTVTPRK